jgi:hypothetical protein
MPTLKPIPNCPGYLIGDDGYVWTVRSRNGRGPFKDRPRRMACNPNKKGYMCTSVYHVNGKRHQIVIHRVVAAVFLGKRPENMEVCHNNDDKADNRLTNLRYDTHDANVVDRAKNNRNTSGVRNRHAKLTEADVLSIRVLKKNGESMRKIARKFSMSEPQISNICNRVSWKHI